MQEKKLDFTFGGYGEGIFYNLPDQIYHSIPAVSSHMVIEGMKSMKKAYSYFNQTFEPTPAFELGRLTHLAILEPDRYLSLVVETDIPDKRHKAYKDAVIENPDKTVLIKPTTDLIRVMRKTIYENALAPKTLIGGKTEVTIFVMHPTLKIPLKGRLDYISKNEDYVLDYKTAAQITWPFFENDSARYGYHVQASYYLMLLELMNKRIEHYFILAQEKDEPFDTVLYKYGFETLEKGREIIDVLLPKIAFCFEQNKWPGYTDEPQVLSLPSWAFNWELKK